MFPTFLLPDNQILQGDGLEINEAQEQISLQIHSIQKTALCPCCQHPSQRVHSRYTHCLADMPCATLQVTLHLTVRRFFCCNPDCTQGIFSERLPDVVQPWARRTDRLAQIQTNIGLMVGSKMGERLGTLLHLAGGDDVLLRLMRKTVLALVPTPAVLGVDNWALRKGHHYGTLLVDLEKGAVVDVLPDREAQTLATWLQAHPGVKIISRDRAGAYAEGARRGAPEARQVADRWHLLKNLGDALVKVLEHQRRGLKALAHPAPETANGMPDPLQPAMIESWMIPSPTQLQHQHARREQRYARYQEVRALRQRGYTLSAVALRTSLDRKTVRKYLQANTFPERQPHRPRWGVLDPHKTYLIARWNEGCRKGAQLYREIRTLGYRGGISMVASFVSLLRKAQGLPPRTRMMVPPTPLLLSPKRRLTPHDRLLEHERVWAEKIPQLDETGRLAVALAQRFATMVRERRAEELATWLQQAEQSGITAFRSFAAGVRRDYAAVEAALSLPWSNGQVEGQVNRLKFIKRQMYGRAHFDLLRRRVLFSG
jgi:transposase